MANHFPNYQFCDESLKRHALPMHGTQARLYTHPYLITIRILAFDDIASHCLLSPTAGKLDQKTNIAY